MSGTCKGGSGRVNLSTPVHDRKGRPLTCTWPKCPNTAVARTADIVLHALCHGHLIQFRDGDDDPLGMRDVEVRSVEYRDGDYRPLHTDSDRP